MTQPDAPSNTLVASQAQVVPYPQLSGVNWPSYLLQAWLALHAIGVPEKNVRFLPEVGHFALPEVVEEAPGEDWERHSAPMELRHPQGAQYDASTGRATIHEVNPDTVRPRLKVNVRADRIWQEDADGDTDEEGTPQQVGRLAHFMEPLLAGLPSVPSPDASGEDGGEHEEERERAEKPLARLTRQICARYPELLRVMPLEAKNVLSTWIEHVQRALEAEDAEARTRWLQQAARLIPEKADPAFFADWFFNLAARLPLPEEEWSAQEVLRATMQLREWGGGLPLETPVARVEHWEPLIRALAQGEIEQQRVMLRLMAERLAQETSRERYRIVRELVEILTTETFTSVAVLDYLWGIGWIHGRVEDFRLPIGELPSPGVFLSFTGGISQRTLLLLLIQRWLEDEGFLGVVSHIQNANTMVSGGKEAAAYRDPILADDDATPGKVDDAREEVLAELCDTNLLDALERQELWSLVAWRREAPDPLLLLQTAAQRLIHPDIIVKWDHYYNVGGGFNTLFSQPGATAALGGMVQVHYPGVTIYMPLGEDEDEVATAAKARLNMVLRLFLPVCLRADVVWKESVARMGQGSYLQHPYQSGVRMAT